MTTAIITFEQLEDMIMDPTVPDSELRKYLTAAPRAGSAFEVEVVPNPTLVRMQKRDVFRLESFAGPLSWGNAVCRWRRQRAFGLARLAHPNKPVLVSEGDSWFQFPFLIDDVIDHLGNDYVIWSLDAAGDTAANMVRARPEYMEGLRARKGDGVAAFLFSGAGNDILGEDAKGKPVLSSLLKPYDPRKTAVDHIDSARFGATLKYIEGCYHQVVATVRTEFPVLPIVIHGYDYAIPFGEPGDARHPLWAAKGEWLGGPMDEKNIRDQPLRRNIVQALVDSLYEMLLRVAKDCDHVHVVNVRGALPAVSDWADEIHGTSQGFGKVAERFRTTLKTAGVA